MQVTHIFKFSNFFSIFNTNLFNFFRFLYFHLKFICIFFFRFTNKIWKLFFWFLLLIYPSLSTRVLRTFACTQIGKVYVLRFDRSVECYTFKWYGFSVGAIGALFIFVLGIPVLFYYLMWRARNRDIKHQW